VKQNEIAEARIRACRKGGQLLQQIERAQPDERPLHSRHCDENRIGYLELLKRIGFSESMARRWQYLALIPDTDLEAWITRGRAGNFASA
jgi:hypothetical protein